MEQNDINVCASAPPRLEDNLKDNITVSDNLIRLTSPTINKCNFFYHDKTEEFIQFCCLKMQKMNDPNETIDHKMHRVMDLWIEANNPYKPNAIKKCPSINNVGEQDDAMKRKRFV